MSSTLCLRLAELNLRKGRVSDAADFLRRALSAANRDAKHRKGPIMRALNYVRHIEANSHA